MNKGGFSWNRFLGVTKAKHRISRDTGVPWTKQGHNAKVGRMVTGGCMVSSIGMVTLVILAAVLIVVLI